MFQTITNIFSVPELRKKIVFTLLMLAFYRIGAHIPTPFVDTAELRKLFDQMSGQSVFGFVDMFTGGAFQQMTIMALGIMPYISASIIVQIMTAVVPTLEKLSKEGESGRKVINKITRYGATGLAAFQSLGLGAWMLQKNLVVPMIAEHKYLFLFTTMIAMTAGCTLLMWIGERITDRGIGNGTSLIIAASIMSGYMQATIQSVGLVKIGSLRAVWLFIAAGLFVATTALVVLIQEGARKIPIQHAKKVVGRGKVQQGASNFLPLKVNTAGVIPVIFASALLTLPQTLFSWVGAGDGLGGGWAEWFSTQSVHNLYNFFGMERESVYLLLKVFNLHTVLYVILTVFFCFFYTAIVFNPTELAENLKRMGAYVPGYKPGKQTADFIESVLERITLVGAVFLVTVALIPQVLIIAFDIPYGLADLCGGTGHIIVVGVVLETMKQIEGQLLMRHYEGFRMKRQAGSGSRRWSSAAQQKPSGN